MATTTTEKKIPQAKKTWVRLHPDAKLRVEIWARVSRKSMSAFLSDLVMQHLPAVPSLPTP
jgi:hypothetical protein